MINIKNIINIVYYAIMDKPIKYKQKAEFTNNIIRSPFYSLSPPVELKKVSFD